MTLFTIIQDYLCYLSPENDTRLFLKRDQLDMVRAWETNSYKEAPLWFYQQYYAMLEVKTQTCSHATKISSYLIQAQSLWKNNGKDWLGRLSSSFSVVNLPIHQDLVSASLVWISLGLHRLNRRFEDESCN